jgi:hypothetical protein
MHYYISYQENIYSIMIKSLIIFYFDIYEGIKFD